MYNLEVMLLGFLYVFMLSNLKRSIIGYIVF